MGKCIGAKRLARSEHQLRNRRLLCAIGENLKTARQELGYTLGEVCEQTGLRTTKLCEWEGGKVTPPIYALQELAVFYGVSMDWLFGQCNDPIEKRSAVELNRLLRDMSTQLAQSWGSAMVAQSEAYDAWRQDTDNFIQTASALNERLRYCLERNRESFEQDWRGGASLMAAANAFEESLQQHRKHAGRTKLMLDRAAQARMACLQNVEGYTFSQPEPEPMQSETLDLFPDTGTNSTTRNSKEHNGNG